MFKFITHRPLWLNMIIALVLAAVLFAIFILSLNLLTHHGKARSVPLVVGKSLSEAQRILDKEGFDIVIQDSLFVDTLPGLAVIKQVPESDAVVKVNRTVYLTLNRSVAPMIDMPNLIGFSYRNAMMNLSSIGLDADTAYKSDFAKNSVLEQLYNEEPIKPGTKIRMGSRVLLILGSGVGEMVYAVPSVIGMTYGEAKTILQQNGINLLVLDAPGVRDTVNAFIVDQNPRRYNEFGQVIKIRNGQFINVNLSTERPAPTDSSSINQPIQ